MKRTLFLLYGLVCYGLFLGVLLYTVGFVGGFLTPTQLDALPDQRQAASVWLAAGVDVLLVAMFGVQHSVMARPAFKRALLRWLPAALERSTYVLATNGVLALLFWQWRPLGGNIWHVSSDAGRLLFWLLFALGWLTVLSTTCLINHLDLFGLRQTWLYFRGRPYTPLPFVTPGPYRLVRHPLYVGWLLVFWSTPTMTASHLLLAGLLTAYILIAIRYEERDLVEMHPDYATYRRRVPMLIPRWSTSVRPAPEPVTEPVLVDRS